MSANGTAVGFADKQDVQEQQVASIINDIPLLSVGIMAFGTFMFLTAMKKASLPYSILFMASFLMFFAAILDLSRVLAEVKSAGMITSTGQQLGVIRDVGLALSVGLIYLFMWLFVAERPQVETLAELQQQQQQQQQQQLQIHSGSWHRWGLFGEILKWLTLVLSLVTPPLRITWHQLNPVPERDSLLIADATLEVVLSAMFIFKLILNAILGRHGRRWMTLRDYLVPIVAMAVSVALAIGNLAVVSAQANAQAFTDATIGQFLLSIEVYMLLLFALINAFYQDIQFAVTPVDQEWAPSTIGTRDQMREDVFGNYDLDTMSTWIGHRRTRSIGQLDPGLSRITNQVSRQAMMERSTRAEAVVPKSASRLYPGASYSPINALAYYTNSKPLPKLPRSDDGRLRRTQDSFSIHSLSDCSMSSIDKILPYRENLERTMTNSKSTYPRNNIPSIPPQTEAMSSEPHRRVSNASNQAITFTSTSDLSLSSFPVPPPSAVKPHSPQSLIAQWTTRKSRRRMAYIPVGALAIPSENPQSDLLAVPRDTRTGHESAGTQYDVTSFIDDLTTPGRSSSVYRVSDSARHEAAPRNESPLTAVQKKKQPTTLSSDTTNGRPQSLPVPARPEGRETHSGRGGQGVKTRLRPPPIKVPGA